MFGLLLLPLLLSPTQPDAGCSRWGLVYSPDRSLARTRLPLADVAPICLLSLNMHLYL